MTQPRPRIAEALMEILSMPWSDSMDTLYDKQLDWRIGTEKNTKLKYMTTVEFYDYEKAPFFQTKAKDGVVGDMLTTFDHMATFLNVVCNSLVILVFVRVIGLQRLPSRVVVNLAMALICEAAAQVVHTVHATTVSVTPDSRAFCRFIPTFMNITWILFYDTMTAGLIERIVALNVPTYYNLAIRILAPAVIVGPWLSFTINLASLTSYEFDLGYECKSQLNLWMPDSSMSASTQASRAISIFFALVLSVSMLFQSRKSGDVVEANLSKFELKTAGVIVKVYFFCMLFELPMLLASTFSAPENGIANHVKVYHFAQQIMIFRGVCLLFVLLSRHDFVQQVLLIFQSSDGIKKKRTANLLLVSQSTHMDAGRRAREENNWAQLEPTPKPRPVALVPRGREETYVYLDEYNPLEETIVSVPTKTSTESDTLRSETPSSKPGVGSMI